MIFLYILLSVVFIAVLLFLYLVFPSMRRHKDRAKIKGMMIAHRGLHSIENGIPENSMEAFILAAAKGYGIETDLRLTADGEIVLFHDNTLKRMCGIEKNVDEFTLEELRNFGMSDKTMLDKSYILLDKSAPKCLSDMDETMINNTLIKVKSFRKTGE